MTHSTGPWRYPPRRREPSTAPLWGWCIAAILAVWMVHFVIETLRAVAACGAC